MALARTTRQLQNNRNDFVQTQSNRVGAGQTVAQALSGQDSHFRLIDTARANNDASSVSSVQGQLRTLGYYNGSVNGESNSDLALGVRAYHTANGTNNSEATTVGVSTWRHMNSAGVPLGNLDTDAIMRLNNAGIAGDLIARGLLSPDAFNGGAPAANSNASSDSSSDGFQFQQIDAASGSSDSASVRAVQGQLRALGYYGGSADGQINGDLAFAVRAYHSAHGTASSSSTAVGLATWHHMHGQGVPIGNLDAAAITRLNNAGLVDGLIQRGLISSNAFDGGSPVPTATSSDDAFSQVDVASPGSNTSSVRMVEQQLQLLGYYAGTVDGQTDSDLVLAVRAYHAVHGTSDSSSTMVGVATWQHMHGPAVPLPRVDAGAIARLNSAGLADSLIARNLISTDAFNGGAGQGTGKVDSGQFQQVDAASGGDGASIDALKRRLRILGYYNGDNGPGPNADLVLAVQAYHAAHGTAGATSTVVGIATWQHMHGDGVPIGRLDPGAIARLNNTGLADRLIARGLIDSGAFDGGAPANDQDSQSVSLDTSQPISVSRLTGLLNRLANEPGESGSLSFDFNLQGDIPLPAALQVRVTAWGSLQFSYSLSDTLTSVLAFDSSIGATAGLNLAGFVGGQLGGEFSGGIAARFSSPEDVARWIFQQLNDLQQFIFDNTGRAFLDLDGSPIRPSKDPVVLTTNQGTGTGGVFVDSSVGSATLDGSASGSNTTFRQGDQPVTNNGAPVVAQASERKIEGQASVDVAPWLSISGGFAVAWQSVAGDMNTANDGDYQNVQFNLGFNVSRSAFVTGGTTNRTPRQGVLDGMLRLLNTLERQLPSGVALDAATTMFDEIVDKLYEQIDVGVKNKVELDIDFVLEWNKVLEGGAYRDQYARLGLTVTPRASIGGSLPVASAEVGVSASKTEVLHERLGTETYSYILQNYIFQRNPREWSDFAARHRDQIDAMIQNLSNPEHRNHDQQLASFVRGRDSYEARLSGLEQFFETKRDGLVLGG